MAPVLVSTTRIVVCVLRYSVSPRAGPTPATDIARHRKIGTRQYRCAFISHPPSLNSKQDDNSVSSVYRERFHRPTHHASTLTTSAIAGMGMRMTATGRTDQSVLRV